MLGANAALAAKLLERAETPNQLQIYLELNQIKRPNTQWVEYTGKELPMFPRLSLDKLRDYTLGIGF